MEPEHMAADVPAPPPIVVSPPPLPAAEPLHLMLAGIESGVLGAAIMTAWFALDCVLERQYWWAVLNLWGAGVYHNRVFSMGLGMATLAGAATIFLLHGLGGVAWAFAGSRLRNPWVHLVASFVASSVVYVIVMYGFWAEVSPVVTRVTPMPATLLAYVLYGAALSRNTHRSRHIAREWKT